MNKIAFPKNESISDITSVSPWRVHCVEFINVMPFLFQIHAHVTFRLFVCFKFHDINIPKSVVPIPLVKFEAAALIKVRRPDEVHAYAWEMCKS